MPAWFIFGPLMPISSIHNHNYFSIKQLSSLPVCVSVQLGGTGKDAILCCFCPAMAYLLTSFRENIYRIIYFVSRRGLYARSQFWPDGGRIFTYVLTVGFQTLRGKCYKYLLYRQLRRFEGSLRMSVFQRFFVFFGKNLGKCRLFDQV